MLLNFDEDMHFTFIQIWKFEFDRAFAIAQSEE